MVTMYETIMSLPLIKGISLMHISEFLEKTHIKFLGFQEAAHIVSQGDICEYIYFILKGGAEITSNLSRSFNVALRHTLKEQHLIGANNLFGLSTTFTSDVSVEAGTDMLQLSKQDYMELLHSDNIYLLNYLNYLSAQYQKTRDEAMRFSGASIKQRFAMWTAILTEPDSSNIEIDTTCADLSGVTGIPTKEVERELEELELKELIIIDSNHIRIPSRDSLLESASAETNPRFSE